MSCGRKVGWDTCVRGFGRGIVAGVSLCMYYTQRRGACCGRSILLLRHIIAPIQAAALLCMRCISPGERQQCCAGRAPAASAHELNTREMRLLATSGNKVRQLNALVSFGNKNGHMGAGRNHQSFDLFATRASIISRGKGLSWVLK